MTTQLVVSTRKGLFRFVRNSGGWEMKSPAFVGQNVTLTLLRPQGWFAALNLGHFGVKLQYSADQGETWVERPAPTYPDGEEIVMGDGKPGQPASLKLIWSMSMADGPLWVGTAPGGLFRSDDMGQSWTLIRSLWDRPERKKWFGGGYDYPGIHSLCIDPRNPNRLHLAISCGGVWHTEDAGETWTLGGNGLIAEYMPPELQGDLVAQDPHQMVQCKSSPDHLWIQHHCGVFRTTNGGTSWEMIRNIPPSGFGFAVAVHPDEPNTAWFVPAIKDEFRIPVDGKFVVTRTRDGGKNFDVLNKGLPKGPAYDLVYRHGLAIDPTGNQLAMGSTTGGLWFSEDQGDNWQMLSAHLPPIHAVQFA